MAQQLKDDVRDKILNSATEEFFVFGYEEASLRRIASDAEMTAGNLYRYFADKKDLYSFVKKDTFEKINEMIVEVSEGLFDLSKDNSSVRFEAKKFKSMLKNMADRFVDIYLIYPKQVQIILEDKDSTRRMYDWLENLFVSFIDNNYHIIGLKKEKRILARSFAVANYDGFKEFFKDSQIKQPILKRMVSAYARLYIGMLETDIRNFIG